jgi:hypothetical protein
VRSIPNKKDYSSYLLRRSRGDIALRTWEAESLLEFHEKYADTWDELIEARVGEQTRYLNSRGTYCRILSGLSCEEIQRFHIQEFGFWTYWSTNPRHGVVERDRKNQVEKGTTRTEANYEGTSKCDIRLLKHFESKIRQKTDLLLTITKVSESASSLKGYSQVSSSNDKHDSYATKGTLCYHKLKLIIRFITPPLHHSRQRGR